MKMGNVVLEFLNGYKDDLLEGKVIHGHYGYIWLKRSNRTVYYLPYDEMIFGYQETYPVARYSEDYGYIMEV